MGLLQDSHDPNTLDYSTYLGGEGNDECRGIAVANIGGSEYAYVTGVTYSNTFPIQNPFEPFDDAEFRHHPYGDAFITKLEPDGQTELVYLYRRNE